MKKCERCNHVNLDQWLKIWDYCENCGKNMNPNFVEEQKLRTNITFDFYPPDDSQLEPLGLKIEEISKKEEIKLTIINKNKNVDSSTKLF